MTLHQRAIVTHVNIEYSVTHTSRTCILTFHRYPVICSRCILSNTECIFK